MDLGKNPVRCPEVHSAAAELDAKLAALAVKVMSWPLRRVLPVLGQVGAVELFPQHAGERQQRTAWPVVDHHLLGLPGGIERDPDDDIGVNAANLRVVVLDEPVVADRSANLNSCSSYSSRAVPTMALTSSGPCAVPSIAAASTVTSPARLSSHTG